MTEIFKSEISYVEALLIAQRKILNNNTKSLLLGINVTSPSAIFGSVKGLYEEFGPVAPIVIANSDEQAIELSNATEFGLIAFVYSSDLKRAIKVAESLESGMVAINKGVFSDPAASFGGFKQSSLGSESGFARIEEFSETKYIGVEI